MRTVKDKEVDVLIRREKLLDFIRVKRGDVHAGAKQSYA
jgi:hypothetical protein